MTKQAQHSGALANPLQKLCDVDVCKTLEHDRVCTVFIAPMPAKDVYKNLSQGLYTKVMQVICTPRYMGQE